MTKSIDQIKKESFDRERELKLSNSKIKCKEYWIFSNRQIDVWSIIHLKTIYNDAIIAKVIKKPFYMDKFWKARYRGYIVCELENWDRFVSHVDNIFKK